MRTKRKRINDSVVNAKRLKSSGTITRSTNAKSQCDGVLSFCYIEVHSLRQFLANSLPSSSRVRRRRINIHMLKDGSDFLDSTMVGISTKLKPALEEERHREFVAFTQSQQRLTHSSDGTPDENHLAEVRLDDALFDVCISSVLRFASGLSLANEFVDS